MNFKSLSPSLGSSVDENFYEILGYLEDLKIEIEVKLTSLESTIEKIKTKIEALEGVVS